MHATRLLHIPVEKIAATYPKLSAIIYNDSVLTYQELNNRANQLAYFLLEQGAKENSIIAVYLNTGFDQIISILAILKIGAVYLPLDQSYPKERLKYVLENSEAILVLTTSDLQQALDHKTKIINLDENAESLKTHPIENLSVNITEKDLAYIIYTSGSTGKPKGVMIEHRNACNTVSQMGELFSLLPSDKILLNISLAFDPSIWMIFWPLSVGSCLVLCESLNDPEYLCQQIIKHEVRLLHAGPTLFRILINQEKIRNCNSLELILGGGEAWKVSDLEALRQTLPTCELCNVYGPTEASIHVTYWQSHGILVKDLSIIPIGKPIHNMQCWILDSYLNEVAVGEVGGLYLSGAGIGRGYLNQPVLTKEKFINTPDNKYAERLYNTGDLAQRLPDGNFVFIGRADDQVKLRGFRIELLEIENQILESGLVKDICILKHNEDGHAEKLVAFYVSKMENDENVATKIKDFLKTVVPAFMLPSQYVLLDSLPITTNQKVDKKALLSMLNDQTKDIKNQLEKNSAQKFAESAADLTLLMKLWCDVLRLESISLKDNFFDIGGDSLSALELIGKINLTYQSSLSVVSLFKMPVFEDFYENVKEQCEQKLMTSPSDKIFAMGDEDWPLSDNQLWLLRMAKKSRSINNIVIPYKIDAEIDPKLMHQAVVMMQEQQPILCSNIRCSETGEYSMFLNRREEKGYDFIDLSEMSAQQQIDELQICEEMLNTQLINVESDALFKVVLLQCGQKDFVMYVFMHHLISDPFSGVLTLRILMSNYTNLLNKIDANHEQPIITFLDYVKHEVEKKKTIAYSENLKSWKSSLLNKNFYVSFGKMEEENMAAGYISVPLPETLAKSLKDYAKKKKITLFSLLLSIMKQCIHDTYSQKQFNVGINLSRRDNSKWEKMIGPLSEQSISHVDFNNISGFNELLNVTLNNLTNIFSSPATIEDVYKEIFPNTEDKKELFNVLFDYEKQEESILIGGMKIKHLPVKASHEVRRHLSMRVSDKVDNMYLQVRYRKSIFTDALILDFVKKYLDIAAVITNNEFAEV